MKRMKKIMALVFAMVMVFSLTVTANAATITINQNPGTAGTAGAETYVAYKIFDVTKTSDVTEDVTTDTTLGAGSESGFSYTIAKESAWVSVLNNSGYFTLTESANGLVYNVKLADDSYNTSAYAITIADYLLENKPTTLNAVDKQYNITSDGTTATATVDDGYYLITSTLGTNLVLATSNITINTKNEYITATKTVEKTNYNVGDHVAYTITVNLPASVDYTKQVVVHDTLDSVLSFNEDVEAKIGTDDFKAFSVSQEATDDCTFEITLDISGLAPEEDKDPVPKSIVFTYTAELTSDAAADTGYVNKEFTTYSQYKTTEKTAEIKTFDFDLEKTFTGSTDKTLEATFKLYPTASEAKGSTAITFKSDATGYVKVDSNDGAGNATITVTAEKPVNVRGLEAGTYYLTELTTASGYNLLTEDVKIVIAENGNVTINNSNGLLSAADSKITVTNNTGTVLPSTGGIGTTILYIIGGILVLVAVIFLIVKKRMKAYR